MELFADYVPDIRFESIAVLGVQPSHVETMAFAWLAYAYERGIAGNVTSVTGATNPAILGCKYKAKC